jgi:hypothetical protein
MAIALDSSTITHGIQLAVAPVFFLTAVAGMIGAVAGRLARIIDRARVLQDRARTSTDEEMVATAVHELTQLRKRGGLANACIALLTGCGFLIGMTIVLLFLDEITDVHSSQFALGSFLMGVVSFLLALLCFFAETVIAGRTLRFDILSTASRIVGNSKEP